MNTIMLTHPKAGQHTALKVIPGNRLSMEFVLEEATVERQGENLVFIFDDGSSIIIENFYVDFTGENLPEFEVDGQIISGSDFFASLGSDLTPAAGPEAARSARYSEMGNADLASGIDHLDGLDMSIPGSAVSMEGQLAAPLMNLGAGNYSGPGSEEGPTVPPIEQSFVADVRAVMYNTGPNSADHVVTTPIFFKNADGSVLNLAGAPAGSYAVSWSFPADWDSSWLADPVVENGQLIFKLSPEGLQMLQQTGDDSFLRGFVTVTVTMNGQTSEYKVEVVGTQGTYFNSADYDEQYGAVSGLGTDYIGEYHQGSGQNGSYHITSSSKNNDIVLNDSLIGGSYVHASGNPSDMGHDFNTVFMNKGVINTGGATAVTSYDGTLRVHGGISAEGSAASNSIDMGKGQIHVSNNSGHGVSASQGTNTISGNQIFVEGGETGVYAENGGQNSIINTGDKTLAITGEDEGVYAYGAGSSNHISNQQGTVDITGQALEGLAATGNGANYVFGKDVNITGASGQTISGGGISGAAGIFASGGSINEVTAINGDVTVKGHRGMEAVTAGSNDVSVEGQGNITVTGQQFGVGALSKGANNTLTVEQGAITVTASDGEALLAADGKNKVTGAGGDITLEGDTIGMKATGSGRNEVINEGQNVVEVTGWLDGMSANGSLSANSILADEGTVNVTGQFGEGLAAVSGGANYIIGKDINIASGVTDSESGQSESFGAGLFATKAGINEVTAINGDVDIKGLRGMEALNAGSNDVSVEGQGNITVTGQQFGVGALSKGANNTLTVEQGAITVTASDGEALLAADGKNKVTGAGGDITLEGGTTGMKATGSGRNEISSKGSNVITVEGWLDGMSADGSLSANSILADEGTVNVSGQYAVSATSGGANYIIGKDINIAGARQEASPTGPPTEGAGMFVSNGGDNQITAADGGTVHISGSRGMDVTGHGTNDVSIDGHGSINVAGELYGMQANGASSANSISLDSGSVSVAANHAEGITNYATAMSALNGGHNEINGDGSVTVSITATAAAAGNAIAMWAKGGGSLNIINGGQGSSVTITAQDNQGGQKIALSANDGGRNEISLGAGSEVIIQGSVSTDGNAASENKIVVSGSGNYVTVSGSVAQGSLNIVANDDNAFTLILQASNIEEFTERYAEWLNGLTDSDFFAGLDSIKFQLDDGWSGADEAALRDALSDFLGRVDEADGEVSFTGSHNAQPESHAAAFEDAQPGHDGSGGYDASDDYDSLNHGVDGSAYPALLFSSDGGDSLEGDAHLYDDPMLANYYEAAPAGDAIPGSQQDYIAFGQSLAGMDGILREGDDSLDSVLQPGPTAGEHTDGHKVDVVDVIDLTNKDALEEAALATASAAQSQAAYNGDHGPIATEPEMPIGDVSGEVARQMMENS